MFKGCWLHKDHIAIKYDLCLRDEQTRENMDYIIYVSTASKPMSEMELAEILSVSRRKNEEIGVTGILIYRHPPDNSPGAFIQLLEGDKKKVMDTYNWIVKDPRHHSKIIIEEGQTTERQFPDWSMGFKNLTTEQLEKIPGFADIGTGDFDSEYFKKSQNKAREALALFCETD